MSKNKTSEKVFKRQNPRRKTQKEILETIFEPAKTVGIQYVLTLLRVEGWTSYEEDAIDILQKKINNFLQDKSKTRSKVLELVETLKNEYSIYSLFANLVGNSSGKNYIFCPLPTEAGELGIGFHAPKKAGHITELARMLREHIKDHPSDCIEEFSSHLDEFVKLATADHVNYRELKKVLLKVSRFLDDFISIYRLVLLNFKDDPLIYRLPGNLMVMELLVGEKGLQGFKLHHPDGATSYFERKEKGTEQTNYMIEQDGIVFTGGFQDNYEPMYKINGEYAYIKGVPGKYNVLGEWKPIVYPGSHARVEHIVKDLVKDEKDKRVHGCLFYIVATCHHCIEFILKTRFDLPFETNTITGQFGVLHMQKITLKNSSGSSFNYQVYDCTLGLNDISVESIKYALQAIDVIVNRLTFRVDNSASWFLKYPSFMSSPSLLNVSKKDVPLLNDYLVNVDQNDSINVDTAISWYLNGKNASNVFTSYLSFYIALESLAISFATGELKVCKRYRVKKKSKAERKKMRIACIKKMHEELYPNKPEEFVRESYSECITSLRKLTQFSLERVLGKKDKMVKNFFKKKDGYSLYNLRNELAHGSFSHIDTKHADLISERVYEIQAVAHEFILRLSSKSADKKRLRKINNYSMSMDMGDPRSCYVTSTLDVLPRKDWRIIPEWLD